MSSIVSQLESLLGTDAVLPWQSVNPVLQAQSRRAIVPETAIDCVAYPSTVEALAEVMTCARQNRWRVLPCGHGSKLHWGGLLRGNTDSPLLLLSTARLNRLVEHAVGDLTVTAEAGMGFADLQARLSQAGQFLAIDPAYPDQATLGGIVATADTGGLRQRYGGVRDMLIGLELVRSDGKVAKAGGRVVKNVAGYDLMKLFTGSYGTLGIISQLTFRIYPLPVESRTVVLTGEAGAMATAAATLLASALTPTVADLVTAETIAALCPGSQGMGLMSRFQSIEISAEKQAAQLLEVGQTLGLTGVVLQGAEEAALWRASQISIATGPTEAIVTAKIGILPAQAVATLTQLTALVPDLAAHLHSASGLGTLRFDASPLEPQTLLQLRSICEAQGGFLSLLDAPLLWKQTLDLWGYPGNGLDLMRRIKQQFDPGNLLSPQRFVGGI